MKISIITCTYNPDEKALSKLLDAVCKLIIPDGCELEYIIIDNNSSPALSERAYVHNFLQVFPKSKLHIEQNQGLTYARLRGFKESSGDIIIFFDDDNVADPDYLVGVKKLFEENVQVGIWGPGVIDVVFMEPVPKWVDYGTRGIFQEKKVTEIEFGYSLTKSSFHPFGTGMSLRREIVQFYYDQFVKNGLTTSDRKGESLASCGDLQLLYVAYTKGFATGVSPSLKMKHLIPTKRTTIDYICKLLYGSYSTIDKAFIEIFPEFKSRITIPSEGSILKGLVKIIVSTKFITNPNKYRMNIAYYIGITIGKYKALNRTEPTWLIRIVKSFKLE